MMDAYPWFWPACLVISVLGVYFFPSLVASERKLKNSMSIFVLNVFLGWTLLGWVIALCLAVSGTAAKKDEV